MQKIDHFPVVWFTDAHSKASLFIAFGLTMNNPDGLSWLQYTGPILSDGLTGEKGGCHEAF